MPIRVYREREIFSGPEVTIFFDSIAGHIEHYDAIRVVPGEGASAAQYDSISLTKPDGTPREIRDARMSVGDFYRLWNQLEDAAAERKAVEKRQAKLNSTLAEIADGEFADSTR
jgi:hypothetical protein